MCLGSLIIINNEVAAVVNKTKDLTKMCSVILLNAYSKFPKATEITYFVLSGLWIKIVAQMWRSLMFRYCPVCR